MPQENPLTIVIFGATGDLYQAKLASALYRLFDSKNLPKQFKVIAFARKPIGDAGFRELTRGAILKKSQDVEHSNLESFLTHFYHVRGELDRATDFKILSKYLSDTDHELGSCSNKLYFLAVPPNTYSSIFGNIHEAGLAVPCVGNNFGWMRMLIEKPFGHNSLDATRMNKMLQEYFDEAQIFHMDHYLAKDTVRDIFNFRFIDGSLEGSWDNKNIGKVSISLSEKNDAAHRGFFYDSIGALRDVGQNHAMQMLALVAMEKPKTSSDADFSKEKYLILKDVSINGSIVHGQYQGYLNEKGIAPNSTTETFFRINLNIKNSRWEGVTFELEAGKAMDKSEVRVDIYFKDGSTKKTFLISPTSPGPDAYEKVFSDAIVGDKTSFVSAEEIMAEWKIVDEIMNKWQHIPLVSYQKGSSIKEIK